ncbi:MAG: hypothetical protein KTR20_06635 [Cellvibrionaceae bacterium]|nr:hypothetical protein [Cellvibrionaceae bacterium]
MNKKSFKYIFAFCLAINVIFTFYFSWLLWNENVIYVSSYNYKNAFFQRFFVVLVDNFGWQPTAVFTFLLGCCFLFFGVKFLFKKD